MATTAVNVGIEHVMATDGRFIPIGCVETKRVFNNDLLVSEEFYYRGNVYAMFYEWDGDNLISNVFTGTYFKPVDPENPKKDLTYSSDEYYPYLALKFMASGVTPEKWETGSWVVGKNGFV